MQFRSLKYKVELSIAHGCLSDWAFFRMIFPISGNCQLMLMGVIWVDTYFNEYESSRKKQLGPKMFSPHFTIPKQYYESMLGIVHLVRMQNTLKN